MSEKITINLFYVGLLGAILGIVLTGFTFHQSFRNQVESDLEKEVTLLTIAYNNLTEPEQLERFAVDELRITLIAPSGEVLYESAGGQGEPVNHLDRPEVQQALATGTGQDTRRSNSLGSEDYYLARRMEDGNVLRISVSVNSMYQIFGQAYPLLILIVLVVLVLSVIIALVVTRRLVRPIEQLPGKLDDPNLTENSKMVYPELVPFVKEIQSQRREQEAMRQEFTANVTHELKTPLTTISGYAEIIATGIAKPQDVPRFAEKVQAESNRMLNLVNDIIELSKLDQRVGQQETAPVELLKLATECADQLSTIAEKKHVTVTVAGTPLTVEGEEYKLWELIYNLIDNAIRYNREDGWVRVLVAGNTVTVKDNGIGIPKEHQGRIFERFYRVDKSHSRAAGGTGLGLSIVKHIAEQHNAYITLLSEAGLGTEIRVTFPEKP